MGTLTKNTARQSKAATSNPPTAGPAIAPLPTTLMWVPSALPRSAPLKADMTVAIPLPWIIADPTPWNALATISQGRLAASPARADPATKTASPPMYTRLRPAMSPSRPIGRIRALITRALPTTTHCTVGKSVPKCSSISGSAISADPLSTTDTKVPMAMAAKTHHLNRGPVFMRESKSQTS